MSQLVFVFGTLKEGFPNFATNKGRKLPGAFITQRRYPLYLVGDRHSPWLVDQQGDGEQVLGEVFEVDEQTLQAMDVLERTHEPDGYRRVMLPVEPVDGLLTAPVEVHAYLKRPAQLPLSEVRAGPLRDYTLAHAALYRPRGQEGVRE